MHLYFRKDGRLAMRSEQSIQALVFRHLEIDLTEEEKNKLEKNYSCYTKEDGTLEFDISFNRELTEQQKQEDEKQKKDLISSLKVNLLKSKTFEELKSVLSEFLNLA